MHTSPLPKDSYGKYGESVYKSVSPLEGFRANRPTIHQTAAKPDTPLFPVTVTAPHTSTPDGNRGYEYLH